MTETCAGCGKTISLIASAETVPIGGIIDDKDYCNLCYVEQIVNDNYRVDDNRAVDND